MHLSRENAKRMREAVRSIVKEMIKVSPELEEGLYNFVKHIETSSDVKRHLDFLEAIHYADKVFIASGDYDNGRGCWKKMLIIKGKWSENGINKYRTKKWIIGYTEYPIEDKVLKK